MAKTALSMIALHFRDSPPHILRRPRKSIRAGAFSSAGIPFLLSGLPDQRENSTHKTRASTIEISIWLCELLIT